jgi:hypothetical protein
MSNTIASNNINTLRWEEVQQRFNTLSRAMQRSKFTETELLSKCRELKGALVEKAHQLQLAQATKLEDEHTIQALRAEMQKAVAKADNSYAREQAARQLVVDLQQEVENLRAKLAAEAVNREKELDSLVGGGLNTNTTSGGNFGAGSSQGMFSESIGTSFPMNKSSILKQSPFEVYQYLYCATDCVIPSLVLLLLSVILTNTTLMFTSTNTGMEKSQTQ